MSKMHRTNGGIEMCSMLASRQIILRLFGSLVWIMCLSSPSLWLQVSAGSVPKRKAMTDDEIVDCFHKLNDILEMTDDSYLTKEGAAILNQRHPILIAKYCSMTEAALLKADLRRQQRRRRTVEVDQGDSRNDSAGQESPSNNIDDSTVQQANRRHRRIEEEVDLFPPNYPEEEEVSFLYQRFGFTGNVLDRLAEEDGFKNRCNTNDEAEDVRNLLLAEIADEALQATCDLLPPSCPAAGVSGNALVLWRVNVEGCAFHDELVDNAETEATYENMIKLFDLVQDQHLMLRNLIAERINGLTESLERRILGGGKKGQKDSKGKGKKGT